jgi:DNA-binding CsgD family transcriptional regulator
MYPVIGINDDFSLLCKRLEFDLHLDDYKEGLLDWSKLDATLIMKNQFFWINDFTKGCNVYVHPNVELITGYSIEDFKDFAYIFSITHPDDREYAFEFAKRAFTLSKDFKPALLEDPLCTSISIDFRIKCKNENLIRINRHSSCFKTDKHGNVVYGLALFTDLSHFKKNGHFTFLWHGKNEFKHHFDDLVIKYHNGFSITGREKDVLSRLSNGFSATKIARELSISVHTVISHRKKLLQKTGTKNTAQLIKFSMENGIL